MILKYLAWLIGVGVPFAGAWFVNYTETDQITGRKRITRAGYYGLSFAILGLILALSQTIKADISAIESRERTERAEMETIRYRSDIEQRTLEIHQLLSLIEPRVGDLTNDELLNVSQLSTGIEGFRSRYPELYDQAMNASDFQSAARPLNQAREFDTIRQFVGGADCEDWEDVKHGAGSKLWNLPTDDISFALMTHSTGTMLTISREASLKMPRELDFSRGLTFEITDGTVMVQRCTDDSESEESCLIRLSESVQTRRLHQTLKKSNLQSIRVGLSSTGKTYSVDQEDSENVRSAVHCVRETLIVN